MWWKVPQKDGIHVAPCESEFAHDLNLKCVCGPSIEWVRCGDEWPPHAVRVVVHHALEGDVDA